MNNRQSRIARSALLLVAGMAGALIQLTPANAAANPVLGQPSQQTAQSPAVPVVADAVPASAPAIVTSQPAGESGVQATRGCPLPYLSTGYGPLAQCTQVSGASGRAGFYSPLTGQFSPTTGWLPVHAVGWYSWNSGTIRGWTSLQTAYGPAVWATQYSGGPAGGAPST